MSEDSARAKKAMESGMKAHEECDACGFVTDVEPFERQGVFHRGQKKQLCALCAGTMTGAAMDYAYMERDLNTLKTICYVGNAILRACSDASNPVVVRHSCAEGRPIMSRYTPLGASVAMLRTVERWLTVLESDADEIDVVTHSEMLSQVREVLSQFPAVRS